VLQAFERGAAYERSARLVVWGGAAPEDLAAFRRALAAYFPALQAAEVKPPGGGYGGGGAGGPGRLEITITSRVSDDLGGDDDAGGGGPEGATAGAQGREAFGAAAGTAQAAEELAELELAGGAGGYGGGGGGATLLGGAAGRDASALAEDQGSGAGAAAAPHEAAAARLHARGGAPARAAGAVEALSRLVAAVSEGAPPLLRELSEALEAAASGDDGGSSSVEPGSMEPPPPGSSVPADLAACVAGAAREMGASADAARRMADALGDVAASLGAAAAAAPGPGPPPPQQEGVGASGGSGGTASAGAAGEGPAFDEHAAGSAWQGFGAWTGLPPVLPEGSPPQLWERASLLGLGAEAVPSPLDPPRPPLPRPTASAGATNRGAAAGALPGPPAELDGGGGVAGGVTGGATAGPRPAAGPPGGLGPIGPRARRAPLQPSRLGPGRAGATDQEAGIDTGGGDPA
jgi:hypothetical protein